jgi:hypothetical protein
MKKIFFITFLLIVSFLCIPAMAKPIYIYEQANNPNFHIHVDYGASRGLTVAWFRVKPSVQTLKSWKCHYDGSYHKLRCPEPGGAIQFFKISSDKNWFYMGVHAHKLIKVVN